MKKIINLALLWGAAVLVQGSSLFGNRKSIFSNNVDNRQNGLGLNDKLSTRNTTQIPEPRISYYGREFISPTSPFEIVYEWKILDFEYPSAQERIDAINSGEFIQENVIPLGMDAWKNRLFISIPRWKVGNPASLASVDLPSRDRSPVLRPYPNWESHTTPTNPDCRKIMSVFRIHIDECGRLWALDAGLVNTTTNFNYVCPPKILIFDLETDQHVLTYRIPDDQVKEDNIHTSIFVDVHNGKCDDAHAYVADAWRNGLLVFSLRKRRSWRVTHHFMMPDPHACEHNFHNEVFYQWTDGIFTVAVGLEDAQGERLLYFHPMSSFEEFSVPISILQNETIWTEGIDVNRQFKLVGYRGPNSQSSSSAINRDGVLFFTLVDQDAVGCWDTNKPLLPNNIHHVDQSQMYMPLPNDLKLDKEVDQGVWVLANNIPRFLYSNLDYNQVNVRILRADTKAAVKDSVCDPRKQGNVGSVVWN